MTTTIQLQFETLTCCHQGCGIVFAVPRSWELKRREDHSDWYCPNGHSQYFSGKTDAEIAREALARERANHDQTRADRERIVRERNAARGQVTKIKNRVHAGVCIHCNRSFQDLARHMESKHVKEAKAPA